MTTITDRYALAEAIAVALIKLDDGAPWKPQDNNGNGFYLVNGDEALFFHQMWNEQDRIRVTGSFGHDRAQIHNPGPHEWNDDDNPEISCALARGPDAIARDIARKVLPVYRPLLAPLTERLARNQQADAQRDAAAQRLAAILGSVPDADGRFARYAHSALWKAEVSMSDKGPRVSMELRGLTETQAVIILHAIKEK